MPLVWEKTIHPKWHLYIYNSSCINVDLMSTNKWTQSTALARCYLALSALCKCGSLHLPPSEKCLGSLAKTQELGNKVLQESLTHRSKVIKKKKG